MEPRLKVKKNTLSRLSSSGTETRLEILQDEINHLTMCRLKESDRSAIREIDIKLERHLCIYTNLFYQLSGQRRLTGRDIPRSKGLIDLHLIEKRNTQTHVLMIEYLTGTSAVENFS